MVKAQQEKQNGMTSVEFVAQAGHKVLTFLDLEATELAGRDQYRNATNKITAWSIKE